MYLSKDEILNKELLLEIFDYLNARLAENQLQLELTIYGGCLMNLLYDNRPATKDVDCVFASSNEKLLTNILETTQQIFDLSNDWINQEIKEPLAHLMKEDIITFKAYSNLTILRPDAKQLLAMKILSARPEPSKDFIDAYLLCKDLGITTKKELLSIVRQYIPLSLLGERQNQFIMYLGGDLGYDWK